MFAFSLLSHLNTCYYSEKLSCQFSIMNLFSSGLPFKISVLHCCTCCLSFLKADRNENVFVSLPLRLICFTGLDKFYLLLSCTSLFISMFPQRITGVSIPPATLRHRYKYVFWFFWFFFFHKCGIFDIGVCEDNKFYSN